MPAKTVFKLLVCFKRPLFACFLMWYGAGLAGIKKSGFWRSLFAAFSACVVSYLFALAALVLNPQVQTLYGFAAGLLLSIFVIKGIYHTSFLKALVPWSFLIINQAHANFFTADLFIGGFTDQLEIIQ